MTAYREVSSSAEIARELKVAGFVIDPEGSTPSAFSLDERSLDTAGFEAFASFRTNRIKYR